jgi:hypothetical protein
VYTPHPYVVPIGDGFRSIGENTSAFGSSTAPGDKAPPRDVLDGVQPRDKYVTKEERHQARHWMRRLMQG